MQERRTTIRIEHACRAQYCPADDLLPRDGRLLNLSERGAGLLVREPRRQGEQVTVSFSFPGDAEATTATGTVRWSEPELGGGGWHRAGIQWLPLEEIARNRLHRFLYQQTRPAQRRPGDKRGWRIPGGRWAAAAGWGGIAILVLASALLFRQIQALQGQNTQLGVAVAQRNSVIKQLNDRTSSLQTQLTTTRGYLAETAGEVARLDQHAQVLGGQVSALSQDVERFQRAYTNVQEQREALIHHVIDLEQERLILSRRLVSSQEVSMVVQEAVNDRRRAKESQLRLELRQKREAADHELNGNEGYVIRDGRPTIGRSTVWIRVYDPEATSSTAPAGAP